MVTALALLRRILAAIPIWAWAIAAALAWGGFQHRSATAAGKRAVEAEQQLATLRLDAAQVAKDALARLVSKQQEAVRDAQAQIVQHRAGADAAADALRRLRARAAGSSCATPSTPPGSAAAANSSGVCSGLLDGVGSLAQRYADIANERGRAGAACERSCDEK